MGSEFDRAIFIPMHNVFHARYTFKQYQRSSSVEYILQVAYSLCSQVADKNMRSKHALLFIRYLFPRVAACKLEPQQYNKADPDQCQIQRSDSLLYSLISAYPRSQCLPEGSM